MLDCWYKYDTYSTYCGTCVRLLWRYMNNLKKKYLISCQCIHFIVHYWGVFCNKYQFKFKDRKRHIKWRLFYLRYLETDLTSQCAFCNKMKRFVDRIETFVHCNAWYGYTALNCADFFLIFYRTVQDSHKNITSFLCCY